MLLIRRRGTSEFLLPGDRIEDGEDARGALIRWMHDKLELVVASSALIPLSRFRSPAANYPGRAVDAEVFKLAIVYPVTPTEEVAEAVWIDSREAERLQLGELTREHLLPVYRQLLNP